MRKISILFAIILLFSSLNAQERSLTGRITSEASGTGLMGAHISINSLSGKHFVFQGISGKDGYYSAQGLPAEKLLLTISYLGYRSSKAEIDLTHSDLTGIDIVLKPSAVEVGEVMVSVERQDRMLRDVSLPLALVTKNRVDQLPGVTPANLFKDVPGINLSRDGIWATSMNIRGLSEQRIVALVDGNRIETATDIAAGLAMIDVNDIERIEVIKGAASSLYGTGALGGVVNIITREGNYHDTFYAGGSTTGSFQTVNNMGTGNIAVDLADEKWYVRLSGTYRDAANTQTPEGELLNSQFTDNNISMKLGVKPVKNHEFTMNYQRFNARDVGIPGGSAFPVTATASYSDIQRNMLSAAYTININDASLKRIRFRYFHQYILRDVELKPSAVVTLTPSGYHTTNGFQAQTDWNFGERHKVIAGVDIWQRFLSTEREKKVVSPGFDINGNPITNITIRGEVPIPDAWFNSGGIYVQDQISMIDGRLSLTLGGRFDLINTRNDMSVDPLYLIVNGVTNENPPKQRITFEADNINNYSWSLDAGILYHLYQDVDLTFTASKAYRAPSIEERFKYIDLLSSVRIGDPNLRPEQGYFFDIGTRIWKEKFQLSGNVFANVMTDLIVESPGLFIYNYSDQPENYDTLSALINSNVEKALLYGFDVSAAYTVFSGLTIKAMAGYVRGKNTLKDTDLPQIPPLNGRLGLKYNFDGILSTELSVNLTAGQDKVAVGEKVSSGYASYDLGIYSSPLKLWNFSLETFAGIENITDRAYKNHLSTNRGLVKFEPGRNFYVKIRLSF